MGECLGYPVGFPDQRSTGMAVTTLTSKPKTSEAEWELRCNLAALYRILHHLRMTDLIYTHMSARILGEEIRSSSTVTAISSTRSRRRAW